MNGTDQRAFLFPRGAGSVSLKGAPSTVLSARCTAGYQSPVCKHRLLFEFHPALTTTLKDNCSTLLYQLSKQQDGNPRFHSSPSMSRSTISIRPLQEAWATIRNRYQF
ncbi:unnamed protein product [Heterotrigona itama]|uniref:Uncharacterized protein n=1 Tax=Heterotrigona itama TaxID=395501 RepID=A0A6V7GZX9_9HYME|nr:unnamed protein product [Heterotrigona itama]